MTTQTSTLHKTEIASWFSGLQDRICAGLEKLDGKETFIKDPWEREGGGGGLSRVLQEGALIEKGGVNFSAVHGKTPEKILTALNLPESDFFATGVSIVLHPVSPMMPIIHMNVRYFEMSNGVWWFGGGIDVTPHYVVPSQGAEFHAAMKAVCDKHDAAYYPKFKTWADDYFFIKHRKETRGVGGIFFDHLQADQKHGKDALFAFVQEVGDAFVPVYTRLAEHNRNLPYGEKELKWQGLRRGRYVEFNLVLDKGTKFGLDTDGRTESILMSLPKQANWAYDHQTAPGSEEEKTLGWLKKGIDWLNAR